MRVKYFCWDQYTSNSKLEDKFKEEDGYIILLTLTRKINYIAKELHAIVKVIEILEEWKKEKDWYTSKLTYEVDWFGCMNKQGNTELLTLAQAKKMYKETRIKYDTLYDLFVTASEIHYKECPDDLMNKYFSESPY